MPPPPPPRPRPTAPSGCPSWSASGTAAASAASGAQPYQSTASSSDLSLICATGLCDLCCAAEYLVGPCCFAVGSGTSWKCSGLNELRWPCARVYAGCYRVRRWEAAHSVLNTELQSIKGAMRQFVAEQRGRAAEAAAQAPGSSATNRPLLYR